MFDVLSWIIDYHKDRARLLLARRSFIVATLLGSGVGMPGSGRLGPGSKTARRHVLATRGLWYGQ